MEKKLQQVIMNGFTIVIPKMVDYEIRRGFRIAPSKKMKHIIKP